MQVYKYERQIHDLDVEVKSKYRDREQTIIENYDLKVEMLSGQNKELSEMIRNLKEVKVNSLNKQIKTLKSDNEE